MKAVILLLGVLIVPSTYGSVAITEFCPYGSANGDSQVPIGHNTYVEVKLQQTSTYSFVNSSYSRLLVHNNGAISLLEGTSPFIPTGSLLSVPMIVPFWADINTHFGGIVYYRETKSEQILKWISEELRRQRPELGSVNLEWAFVATWDKVAPACNACSEMGSNKKNTFQVILSKSGSKSFVIIYYNGVEWSNVKQGSCLGLGGTPPKAGFGHGDGTFVHIGGSCTDDILKIVDKTNVNQPGKWVFRIDGNVETSNCISSTHTGPLTITPTFMSIFGNNPIKIKGPCLENAIKIRCRFNDALPTIVDAELSSDNQAVCVVPYLYTNGRVQVDLLVTRTDRTVETFFGYIFTTKPNNQIIFQRVDTTSFTITWDRTKFKDNAVLDLELVEFINGVWTSRGVVKEGIQNTGSFTGQLNALGVVVFEKVTNIYVVKLGCTVCVSTDLGITSTNSIISNILNNLLKKSQEELFGLCYDWYKIDQGPPKDVLPCPPTLKQAQVDGRFEPVDDLKPYNPGAEQGFRQRVPSRSGGGSRCTYKNGKLLITPPDCGNVRTVSPNDVKGDIKHFTDDILPWYTCCYLSKNPKTCDLYNEKRPCNNGTGYDPCRCGKCIGDPHITTFDGLYYTYLGIGEYWMIQDQTGEFLMQTRMLPYVTRKGVHTPTSSCNAFVMQQHHNGKTVTLQLTMTPQGIEMLIDGYLVPLDFKTNKQKRTISYNGVGISIYSTTDVRVAFSSGYSFKFSGDEDSAYVLNLMAMASVESMGKIRGLFGVFDSEKSNDFTFPNGRVMQTTASMKEVHEYGMAWRVDAEDTLFTYRNGENVPSDADKNYEPHLGPPNLENVSPQDVEKCKGSETCLFDLAATGDIDMALQTLKGEEEFKAITESLSSGCPKLNDPENGYLEVGDNTAGSTAKVICNDKYNVTGNEKVICRVDSKGELYWDGELGSCVNKCENENKYLQMLCELGLAQ